jgi:hypothetical protein
VKPNLAGGVEVTANVLIKLAGQGNIYVRSLLDMDESDGESADDVLSRPAFATTSSNSGSVIPVQLADECSHVIHNTQGYVNGITSFTQDSNNWVGIELTMNENDFVREEEICNEMADWNGGASLSTITSQPRAIPPHEPSTPVAPASPIVLDDPDPPIGFHDPDPPVALDDPDPFIIKVHRTMIRKDLINIFSDNSIMSKPLVGIIIDARGEEEMGRGTGVMREIFTLFWSEFADSSMIGEEERVPFIRHDYNRETWRAVARILVKGFTDCSYFPLRLSKVFMCNVFYDEALVTVPMLLSSFKCYVSKHEAEIVEQALSKDIPLDSKDLKDFLSNFDCRRVASLHNIHDIIMELAHKELIQKPKYVSDCWSDIIAKLKLYFPTIEDLVAFYKSHEPTNAKVVDMLHADITNDGEREAFNHLKKYVRGLEKSKLYAFLKFVTAADIIITDKIQVSFSTITGAARRPISHTCGCTLELPSTYANFCELREEFSNILSADSWEMNIV